MSRDAYVYHEEPGASGGPLVFAFHGTGGNEHQFVGLIRSLAPSAHIVSPRGDVSEQGALRFFRRTGEGVYDMADLALRVEAMAGFVQSFGSEEPRPRVVGLGYSNGANILAATMFAHPTLFDAAVLMHPLIPFAPTPADFHSRRVLVTAGRRDPICPPAQSEALAAYFRDNGAETALFWHAGGHEIARDELAAVAEFLKPYNA